jgi:hypothetical protein
MKKYSFSHFSQVSKVTKAKSVMTSLMTVLALSCAVIGSVASVATAGVKPSDIHPNNNPPVPGAGKSASWSQTPGAPGTSGTAGAKSANYAATSSSYNIPGSANYPTGPLNIKNQFTFKDPETGGEVSIDFKGSRPSEIRANSPYRMEFTSADSNDFYKKNCTGGVKKFLTHNYVPESIAFASAIGLQTVTKSNGDPAALRHFYEKSLVDPMAHISFLAFMAANHGLMAVFKSAGIIFDPCNPKSVAKGFTKTQKIFTPLAGPLGMVAGMVASNMVQELAADTNVQMCVAGNLGYQVDADKHREACETAYEDWAVSQKISQYSPDLFSMVGASIVQGYGVNLAAKKVVQSELLKRAGRKGALTLALRSITLAEGLMAGSAAVAGAAAMPAVAPVLTFAMTVGNLYVFFEINEHVEPFIKKPLEQRRQGLLVTETIKNLDTEISRLEANRWLWKAQPKPAHCNAEPTTEEIASAYIPGDCLADSAPRPFKMITRLNDAQTRWRQTVLQESYSAFKNWKDYTLNFANTYQSAYNFYQVIIDNINFQRTEGSKPGAAPSKLYTSLSLDGANISVSQDASDAEIAQSLQKTIEAAQYAAAMSIAYRENGLVAHARTGEIPLLKDIQKGLGALYSNFSEILPELNAALARYSSAGKTLNDQQRATLASAIREKKFSDAIRLLNSLLDEPNSIYFDRKLALDTPDYKELAAQNPFAAIRLILGKIENPKPGLGYLRQLGSDEQIIPQELKDNHPGAIVRARTNTMTDYLLASMVCGPVTDKAINKTWLTSINFQPPAIINDLDTNLCGQSPKAGKDTNNAFFDIHANRWTINGVVNNGFLDIIKNQIRPEIVGTSREDQPFAKWWEAKIDGQMNRQISIFRKEYNKIIDEKFLTAMTKTETEIYNDTSFALGAGKSFMAEARTTLYLLERVLISEAGGKPAKNKEIKDQIDLILNRFELAVGLFGSKNDMQWAVYETETGVSKLQTQTQGQQTPDFSKLQAHSAPRAKKAFETNKKALTEEINKLKTLASILLTKDAAGSTSDKMAQPSMAKGAYPEAGSDVRAELVGASFEVINRLVTETDSYFGVVNTIQVGGLE